MEPGRDRLRTGMVAPPVIPILPKEYGGTELFIADLASALRHTDVELKHSTWAVRDATASCDLIHQNSAIGLTCSRLSPLPFVHTMHHP